MKINDTQGVQNILICGIGGQGVVLAGKIIGAAAFESGLDIKKSEVHGMSQRGGSVSTHIRFGEKIFSPLIPKYAASTILSFDIYETLRYVKNFANNKTVVISSDYGMMPLWTSKNKNDKLGNGPITAENISNALRIEFKYLHLVNNKKIAANLGNIKVSNIVSIGLLSNYTDIEKEIWLGVIRQNVPEKTVNLNLKAFLIGRNEGNK
ncbi:indolepyruvate oxidoreductase subunit beta [Candidatus Acidulodesulfobacterium sp. H_13]|uniref:indolepyruvate oxidoreductase subunit beta n=1 Tax=Candidatus Acidulodesulfobacterium sp. H_13 TaxID=3395470 RepID=UPI003AF71260